MTSAPGRWAFTLDFLPPGNNHQYQPIGRQGQKALTREARAYRDAITVIAGATGFRPQLRAQYAVRVVFIMPGWGQDIDSPIKALLDAVFGSRGDHRVVRLEVEKCVAPGIRRTEVEIEQLEEVAASKERVTSYRQA